MSTLAAASCDTETCETCGTAAVEGLNQRGECLHCQHYQQHPTSLETLLRLSLAGVRRDRKSGRFTSTNKKG